MPVRMIVLVPAGQEDRLCVALRLLHDEGLRRAGARSAPARAGRPFTRRARHSADQPVFALLVLAVSHMEIIYPSSGNALTPTARGRRLRPRLPSPPSMAGFDATRAERKRRSLCVMTSSLCGLPPHRRAPYLVAVHPRAKISPHLEPPAVSGAVRLQHLLRARQIAFLLVTGHTGRGHRTKRPSLETSTTAENFSRCRGPFKRPLRAQRLTLVTVM